MLDIMSVHVCTILRHSFAPNLANSCLPGSDRASCLEVSADWETLVVLEGCFYIWVKIPTFKCVRQEREDRYTIISV